MNNCPECGKERIGSEKFCLNCGHKLKELPASVKVATAAPKKRSTASPKQRKLRIASVISVAVLILGLFGAHIYLNLKYDASKKLIVMNAAFTKGDGAKFLSQFNIPEKAVKDEEGFYSYIEDQGWEEIRNQMKKEVSVLENEGISNIIRDTDGNKLISVLNEPILFGLYNDITFMVHPVKVEAEMPLDETTVVMDGFEVKGNEGDSVAVGEFLPGSYEWEASIPSEYSKVETKGTELISGDGDNHFVFSPSLEAGMITVTSDISEATLWINGKSTGKTVKEMKIFGPVALNGTVKILAEAKDESGALVKGETVAVESEKVHIEFAHVQEKITSDRLKQREAEELRQFVEDNEMLVSDYIDSFRYNFEDALNYADFSYITDYFETGSEIQADYLADIERHGSMTDSYNYDFQSNTITGVKAIDENTLLVNTAEMFFFSSNDTVLRYNKTKAYTVKINIDQYYITKIETLASEKVEL